MKPATHHCDLPRPVIRPTSLQTTKFRDGMVITADDLDTAMRYPLAVFQTLIRAYFGCGVICGLKIHLKKPHPGAKDSKDYKDGKKPPVVICLDRGTALGCDGFPIELCAPVSLPLTLDPCCDDPVGLCLYRDPPDHVGRSAAERLRMFEGHRRVALPVHAGEGPRRDKGIRLR